MNGEYENAFFRFYDTLRLAKNADDFQSAATALAKDIGIPWFAYHSLGDSLDVITNYPEEWLRHYAASEYDTIDPLIRNISGCDNIYWDEQTYRATKATKTLIGEAAEFGLATGVTIPLASTYGRKAGLTFAGASADNVSILRQEGSQYLARCAIYFDAFYASIQNAPPENTGVLTLRERQCLSWISRGKTLPETAELVGVSARTLSHYTSSIKEKLGANSLTHAHRNAILSGDIAVP